MAVAAGLAFAGGASAQEAPNGGQPIAKDAVQAQNAAAKRTIRRLRGNRNALTLTRVVKPRPTRQIGMYDSVGTVRVTAPYGTEIRAASFQNIPDAFTAFEITSVRLDRSRNQYVMRVFFPGTQGDPPKLRVTVLGTQRRFPGGQLATRAATQQNNRGRARVRQLEGQRGVVVEAEEVLANQTSCFAAPGGLFDNCRSTLTFAPGRGRTALAGYVQFLNIQNSSFRIQQVAVSRPRNELVVKVFYPGAQGNIPKFRLVLASREDDEV
jgi:hypothetical protein